MLTLVEQPDIYCPNSKSRPVRWYVETTDHVDQFGAFAFFTIAFQTTGTGDGETITVAGTDFETSGATPYTETTWDPNGTSRQVAENFMAMLRSNYNFQGYTFFLSSGGGGIWTVNALANDYEEKENFTFDYSGLSLSISNSQGNGEDILLNSTRIWYQVFEYDTPVSLQRFAKIPYNPALPFTSGIVPIDATDLVRGLVSTEPPDITATAPQIDIGYAREIHLRFGSRQTGPDCQIINFQMYQSARIFVTNSVFQLQNTRAFGPHCPNRSSIVEFLTDRPTDQNTCRGTYEWVHIWIEPGLVFLPGGFRVRYEFFDAAGSSLGTTFRILGVESVTYRLGIGTANLEIDNIIPAGASSYTVGVLGQAQNGAGDIVDRNYSELLTRRITACACKAAEVYFLEDRGSWRTVIFERIEQRIIEQQAIEFNRYIDLQVIRNAVLFNEGARYSQAETADQVFLLVTERITESNRGTYEQLLRAPDFYIKTMDDRGLILRRIIIDRQNYTTFDRNNATRLIIPFRFNTELRTH